MKDENRVKVKIMDSIRTKILALVFSGIVLTCVLLLSCIIPQARNILLSMAQNYMDDMALAAGEGLEQNIIINGHDEAMTPEALEQIIGDMNLKDVESSYTYVTASDGTMLYHPKTDKIGKPVENEAAKSVLEEVGRGIRAESKIITYKYGGENKCASYYVGEALDFVVFVTADEDEVLSGINRLIRDGILATLIIFVIVGVIAFVVTSMIMNPIIRTTNEVVRLSELDFTSHGSGEKKERNSEVGVMRRAISLLRGKLGETVMQISGYSLKLHDAATTMHRSAQETLTAVEHVERAIVEIAEGATAQAQETQTATENIIVMGNMIEDTNEKVGELRESAEIMREAGNTALEIIGQLGNINQKTKDAIEVIADQTNVTNESVLKIKEATEIITDIAEETNLLSLNASIEAARAGEQGRGFAVVASQIQKLAEQSNESAQQITEIIHLLLEESQKSVETMEDVKEVIRQQDGNVEQTATAFRNVKDGIDKSIESVEDIISKTRRLDEARINVVDVVQNLTAIAEENAASTQETSASASEVGAIMNDIADNAQHLNQIADEMNDSMSAFKVDEQMQEIQNEDASAAE